MHRTVLAALTAALLLQVGCSRSGQQARLDPGAGSSLTFGSGASRWISLYDPDRAWNGYTLVFLSQRIPALIDMNGRVVHSWPAARVKSRARLLEDGSLLGIALSGGVVEYDWDGEPIWQYTPESGFAHHDLRRLANGDTLLLVRPDDDPFDEVQQVDRSGTMVWRWRSATALSRYVRGRERNAEDLSHLNSVQELPDNPWFRAGDARFRPGNLLISAREVDRIFILDKQTREITWIYRGDLDMQHEPLMPRETEIDAGRILVFNNRYRSFYGDRRSTIQALDPVTNRSVWQYRTASLFSPTGGVQQPLPNGNLLITSTRGGRTFEITRTGRPVWEWVPPFEPMRSHRYAYDHCPQLAALPTPPEVRVIPPASYRYIDRDVYRFARGDRLRKIEVDGFERRGVLAHNNDCRQMTLPPEPVVHFEYGIARRRALAAGLADFAATFRMTIGEVGADQETELFRDRIDLDGPSWRDHRLDLEAFALEPVEVCLLTELSGLPATVGPEELVFWRRPAFRSGSATHRKPEATTSGGDDLTPEEIEARRRHLEALGYIN